MVYDPEPRPLLLKAGLSTQIGCEQYGVVGDPDDRPEARTEDGNTIIKWATLLGIGSIRRSGNPHPEGFVRKTGK